MSGTGIPGRAPSPRRALGIVLASWRASAPRLLAGAAIAALSALAAVALLALAGGTALAGGSASRPALMAGGALFAGAIALRALGVARIVLRYAERLLTHDATFRALAASRVQFFRALARAAAGGLGYRQAADLLSRLVADVDALDALYLRVAVPFVAALAAAPLLLWLLAREDRMLGLVVGILLALAAVAVPVIAAVLAYRAGERTARAAASLRIAVLDAVSGLREVRAFGADDRTLAEAQRHESALADAQLADARRGARGDAAGFGLGQAAVFAVLLAIATGSLGVGAEAGAPRLIEASVAVFAVIGAFEVAGTLPRAGVLGAIAIAAARRVAGAAAATPGHDGADARSAAIAAPAGYALRFDDVRFGWRPGRPVLEHLSLAVPEGARVAILGASGAGKSTLAQLALGLAVPDGGTVLLGGVPVDAIAPATLRRTVALLNQTTHLFADTIRANLRIGRADADDAALFRALDGAALGDWVRSLPEGLDTWLGEGGRTVSGGQGRRLALARALLSPAPVLILDEPTTGLDSDNEQRFFRALAADAGGLLSGRTVILIAHRLTGAERLDRIWRLSGGRAAAAAA